MRLLFTSLITSSANVSAIVIIRITHCFPAPSERSLQCIGSSSNGSDSRENIKTFDRLNRFNFGRFASTEDTVIQTATLIFSRRSHRSLVIAYVGHRVSVWPQTGRLGSIPGRDKGLFLYPLRPHQHWGPPSDSSPWWWRQHAPLKHPSTFN
jgi:hypothetical protein